MLVIAVLSIVENTHYTVVVKVCGIGEIQETEDMFLTPQLNIRSLLDNYNNEMHHSSSACLGFMSSVVCNNFLKINRQIFSFVFLLCSVCMREFSFGRLNTQSRKCISVSFFIFFWRVFYWSKLYWTVFNIGYYKFQFNCNLHSSRWIKGLETIIR